MMNTFQKPYSELVSEVEELSKENVFVEIKQYDKLSEYSRVSASGTESQDLSEYARDNSGESLESFLMKQLDMIHLSPQEDRVARHIIEALDHKGYLNNFADLRNRMVEQYAIKERKFGDILKIVQNLEPDGVGARSIKECLLIQLDQKDFEDSRVRDILEKVIKDHLDDIASGDTNRIAKKCDIDPEAITGVIAYIKENMTPNPGAGFSASDLNFHIVPSFEVSYEQGEIEITNLEEKLGIKINISDKYKAMLQDPSLDDETRTFLNDKFEKAQTLMENMERRHENLNRLSAYILNHQKAFIKRGERFLEPLLQKDIAEEIGVSPSTVSRICSSKYVRTPHGVFSFKQLCPRGHLGKTPIRLKLMIAQLIADSPNQSDQYYSDLLKEEGIELARRTVTKYRHLLEST